jgi:hypothetical protein
MRNAFFMGPLLQLTGHTKFFWVRANNPEINFAEVEEEILVSANRGKLILNRRASKYRASNKANNRAIPVLER